MPQSVTLRPSDTPAGPALGLFPTGAMPVGALASGAGSVALHFQSPTPDHWLPERLARPGDQWLEGVTVVDERWGQSGGSSPPFTHM